MEGGQWRGDAEFTCDEWPMGVEARLSQGGDSDEGARKVELALGSKRFL